MTKEAFKFDFGDRVRVRPPHEKSGVIGTIDGMPGSSKMLYGVWFEDEERGWAIGEHLLELVARKGDKVTR